MFKNIMVTGILLIMITVLNAKTINTFNPLISTSDLVSNEEELVSRLAADNDFKNYYISNVKFANKIIETKAGSLFLKYLQNTITATEQSELFAKLGLGKQELNAIGVQLQNEVKAFIQKFPELKQFSEKDKKEVLVNALKKVSKDQTVAIKFSKTKNIPIEQCFWAWAACNTLCVISCSYDPNYNSCMWSCTGLCAGSYGICWILAE